MGINDSAGCVYSEKRKEKKRNTIPSMGGIEIPNKGNVIPILYQRN